MHRIYALLFLSAAICFAQHGFAEPAKPAKEAARADSPKPEDVLRQMADYLGKLPAFSCRMRHQCPTPSRMRSLTPFADTHSSSFCSRNSC